MKRNWDLIREVLDEVEAHEVDCPEDLMYQVVDDEGPSLKAQHAILLWGAGFLEGYDASSLSGPALLNPRLTWEGHDLLDTLRSKPVWDKVKSMATEKGLELSFDAVKALGKIALAQVIGAVS